MIFYHKYKLNFKFFVQKSKIGNLCLHFIKKILYLDYNKNIGNFLRKENRIYEKIFSNSVIRDLTYI